MASRQPIDEHRGAPLQAQMKAPLCSVAQYAPRSPSSYLPRAHNNARPSREFHVTLPAPVHLRAGPITHARRSDVSFATRDQLWDSFFGLSRRPYSDFKNTGTDKSSPKAGREHKTATEYLFWYGFAFPLFWLIGTVVLFTPLRPPEDATRMTANECPSTLSAAQSDAGSTDWALVRVVERRWAYLCAIAWTCLLAGAVVVALWTARVGVFANRA
ncbi:hypothetical protein FRC09_016901 [Ceratobasidium sp. 395]|nr:hypothetical protein FRC09_016901 [Ceratobasidium sp. 395]